MPDDDSRADPDRSRARLCILGAVLVLPLVGTLWASHVTRVQVDSLAQAKFDDHVNEISAAIRQRMFNYGQLLRAGAGLFAASAQVGRDEWQRFFDKMDVQQAYPGIQGIGFNERVPSADLERHERRVRAEGLADYRVRPPGTRPEYFPVLYLEPRDERNKRAIGFDVGSEPARRAALDRARDSGRVALTAKVMLVQEHGADVQPGFLMYLPIYRDRVEPDSVEARRAALIGYVSAPFRARDLVAGILGSPPLPVSLELYDGTDVEPGNLLYASRPTTDDQANQEPPAFETGTRIDVAGRPWTLRFRSTPAFERSVDYEKPILILLMGSLSSVFLFVMVSGLVTDLMGRRRAEGALRKSEERFRAIVEHSPTAIYLKDLGGRYLLVNKRFEEWYGLPAHRVLGKTWVDCWAADIVEEVAAHDQEVIRTQKPALRELDVPHANGATHATLVLKFPVVDAAGAVVAVGGINTTISERKKTQEQLRRLFDNSLVGVALYQPDKRWISINGRLCELLGYTREELADKTWVDLTHPEDLDRNLDLFDRAVAREFDTYGMEKRFLRKDGTVLHAEINVQCVRHPDGTPDYFILLVKDISDRIEAEAELRQIQKIEAIGQLTGGVAHDFNNLLTVIIGNAEMLADELRADERLHRMAGLTIKAGEQGAELTRRLLAFARKQVLAAVPTDVNRLVIGMEGLLRRTLGEDIEIRKALADNLSLALIDPAQLESALLNLCVNARDAMPRGGKLIIETANKCIDGDYRRMTPYALPGEYVMLAVTDTGTGMPEDVVRRAFEPFFTTKEQGKGTGLGLSMVYGFVKQSGGHVKIYSEVDLGTTIRLYLPRASSEEATVTASKSAAKEMFARGEMVLVVEDDPMVREFAATRLKAAGYRIFEAREGRAALDILDKEPRIDLLFTDVVMPGGMNGREVAEAARRKRPHLKVLFTSGYAHSAIVHQGKLDPNVHLLSKPYRRDELLMKVREILDGENPSPNPETESG